MVIFFLLRRSASDSRPKSRFHLHRQVCNFFFYLFMFFIYLCILIKKGVRLQPPVECQFQHRKSHCKQKFHRSISFSQRQLYEFTFSSTNLANLSENTENNAPRLHFTCDLETNQYLTCFFFFCPFLSFLFIYDLKRYCAITNPLMQFACSSYVIVHYHLTTKALVLEGQVKKTKKKH